jgi:hypothetical protein
MIYLTAIGFTPGGSIGFTAGGNSSRKKMRGDWIDLALDRDK